MCLSFHVCCDCNQFPNWTAPESIVDILLYVNSIFYINKEIKKQKLKNYESWRTSTFNIQICWYPERRINLLVIQNIHKTTDHEFPDWKGLPSIQHNKYLLKQSPLSISLWNSRTPRIKRTKTFSKGKYERITSRSRNQNNNGLLSGNSGSYEAMNQFLQNSERK